MNIPQSFRQVCSQINVDPVRAVEENWDEWRIWLAAAQANSSAIDAMREEISALKGANGRYARRVHELEQRTAPATRRLNSATVDRLRARALRDGLTPYQLAKLYESFIYAETKKESEDVN